MTGEVFTAWSLFTVFTGGEEEGAGGCCRGWAATVRSQEGRRSSVLVSRRRSGVALQHNTGNSRYIYTLYLSSHLIHCLDILTTIYHCIFTMPMLPTTVPVYKCGPVSSARGNFPHCLRSRYPTILTIAVLLLWAAPVSPICRLSCPHKVGTGHRTPLQTTLHPFPCTLTLSAILATIELNL